MHAKIVRFILILIFLALKQFNGLWPPSKFPSIYFSVDPTPSIFLSSFSVPRLESISSLVSLLPCPYYISFHQTLWYHYLIVCLCIFLGWSRPILLNSASLVSFIACDLPYVARARIIVLHIIQNSPYSFIYLNVTYINFFRILNVWQNMVCVYFFLTHSLSLSPSLCMFVCCQRFVKPSQLKTD